MLLMPLLMCLMPMLNVDAFNVAFDVSFDAADDTDVGLLVLMLAEKNVY